MIVVVQTFVFFFSKSFRFSVYRFSLFTDQQLLKLIDLAGRWRLAEPDWRVPELKLFNIDQRFFKNMPPVVFLIFKVEK